MRNETLTEPPYFIVYPENTKLVSGEISFVERSRQKLRNAVICFVFAPIVGAAIWLFFSRSQFQSFVWSAWSLFVAGVMVIALLTTAISNFYAARLNRQLERGQFLDGQIISSELPWKSRGKGADLRLEVLYGFQTPDGDSLQRSVTAWRHDLWKPDPAYQVQYVHLHNLKPSAEEYKQLQEFAPQPNTPIKIRYVHYLLYRVM